MARSMTAFGRARGSVGGKEILVEMKSVNSRYFDCTVKIGRQYGYMEERVKAYLQQNDVSRGKIEVYIGIEDAENTAEYTINESAVQSYLNALHTLRDKFGLPDDISVMRVAANRDIFVTEEPEEDLEQDWQDVCSVLAQALEAFRTMRESEGERLRADLTAKKNRLQDLAAQVSGLQGRAAENYRTRLETRLRQVLEEYRSGTEVDEARILTECAIFADKTAIDEELVRLNSHFQAFDAAFASGEPVGRRIDFLLQEMNREVNTIGSKAADVEITALVVEMKCELEKIREQIQNIE